ncbi:MAG: hypothetical protein CM1200mP18_22370 [Gammaproteobacteria bacterium]|nr:MAG: hypothetical protein CM1200mP18_22370 [Gammaproteobacteria bacterium]
MGCRPVSTGRWMRQDSTLWVILLAPLIQFCEASWASGVLRLPTCSGRGRSEVEPYRDAVSYGEEHTFAEDLDQELLESMIPHSRVGCSPFKT